MTKRIIGLILAIAAIAVIVIAAIRHNTYTSMIGPAATEMPDYKDIARSRKLIEAQLRAYIGRNTPLNEAGFYVNIYPIDPVMLRAVEVLKTQNDHD